jgi:anti-anti-sigma factor
MDIQPWPDDIILANLPRRFCGYGYPQRVMERVRKRPECDVVVDFSRVHIVGCRMLTWLLHLRQLVLNRGQKLVLCGVAPATRTVFAVSRLDEVLDFVQDRSAAVARLEMPARGKDA